MPFLLRETVSQTFLERVRATPDHPAYLYKSPETPNSWRSVTYRGYFNECRVVSFGLMSLGLSKGDRISLLSNTRYEWPLVDMAILGASAVTVPIYPSNTSSDVAYILNHSESRIVVLEDAKQLQKILDLRLQDSRALPHLKRIIVIDPAGMGILGKYMSVSTDVMTLDALRELGRREEAREPRRFEENLAAAKPDDLLTICYTSGTTGIPKGAMITQDSMISVLEDLVSALAPFTKPESEVILSFLPFSHILGKVESMAGYAFGWTEAFAENLDKLMTNIGEIRPTLLVAVPRIFEKAYVRINAMFEEGPNPKRKLFQWAMRAGSRYYAPIWAGKRPRLRDTLEYQTARRLVFSKIAARFGGRLRYTLCGGAPLPKEIAEYFRIAGVQILEGYGLTETCAPLTFNTPDASKFGTVGRPLPEVTLKIGEDGEVLARSRKIFRGYYKMPAETEEAMAGGWFHTGDIGAIDDQGYLHITDRKKDLIITSAGKNVAPQKIENLAKSYPLINQLVVHGDHRNYLTALITLDKEQVIRIATEQAILFSEYSELIKNPKIISIVERLIDELNRHLASYETIKKFTILPHELTIESGEVTPSLKIRRNIVAKKYKATFDSMYPQEPAL